jgi:hypothetical protein
MDCDGEGHFAKIKIPGPARIHVLDFFDSLGREPLNHLVGSYDSCSAGPGNTLNIGNVIKMAVRYENVVWPQCREINGRCKGIGCNEGIEEEFLPRDLDREAGMAVISDFHGVIVGLLTPIAKRDYQSLAPAALRIQALSFGGLTLKT